MKKEMIDNIIEWHDDKALNELHGIINSITKLSNEDAELLKMIETEIEARKNRVNNIIIND